MKPQLGLLMKKFFLITAGISSLSLGFVGIFVPVLPTTPFVLLAGFCFIKSSQSMYIWLINNRVFGKFIENYIEYKAVSLRSKIISLIFLWACILTTVIFFVAKLWLDILLLIIAISVSIHLITLKQMPK